MLTLHDCGESLSFGGVHGAYRVGRLSWQIGRCAVDVPKGAFISLTHLGRISYVILCSRCIAGVAAIHSLIGGIRIPQQHELGMSDEDRPPDRPGGAPHWDSGGSTIDTTAQRLLPANVEQLYLEGLELCFPFPAT